MNPITLRGIPFEEGVLVPVEIKQPKRVSKFHDPDKWYNGWNGRVYRWHRSGK